MKRIVRLTESDLHRVVNESVKSVLVNEGLFDKLFGKKKEPPKQVRKNPMDAIVSLFSNLAVPVACLIATFYLWNKEREDHKQEQKELTEAIANNTLVMQKLVDKLDKDVN